MAANVTVSWVLPTTRMNGQPLRVTDIDYVKIEMSADLGANWGEFGQYAPDVLSVVVPELESGDWFFRGSVKDIDGNWSDPAEDAIRIPATSAPSALTLSLSL